MVAMHPSHILLSPALALAHLPLLQAAYIPITRNSTALPPDEHIDMATSLLDDSSEVAFSQYYYYDTDTVVPDTRGGSNKLDNIKNINSHSNNRDNGNGNSNNTPLIRAAKFNAQRRHINSDVLRRALTCRPRYGFCAGSGLCCPVDTACCGADCCGAGSACYDGGCKLVPGGV